MKIGILTVSDRCSRDGAEDRSGQNLRRLIENGILSSGTAETCYAVVPDELEIIKAKLLEWVDVNSLDLILTTGGTGCSPRDVTPEATEAVLERHLPGIVIAMITKSLQITDMAMLSRPACGIRKRTLIINLPGSQKGSQECLEIVAPAVGHAMDLIQDRQEPVETTHHCLQSATTAVVESAGESLTSESEADSHYLRSDMVHVPHLIKNSSERNSGHGHISGDDGHHHQHGHHHGNRNHGNSCGNHHSVKHHHHHHGSHHHKKVGCKPTTSAVDEYHVARRPRKSLFPIVSVDDAIQMVMSETYICGTQTISYLGGLNRVLAEDVYAADALPPFPASIKDGYAVLASDGAGPRHVMGCSTAGDLPSNEVISGWCMRISTGAPLPRGADAVVQVEDTVLLKETEDGKEELEIDILVTPFQGQDIREVGSDIVKGDKILSSGMKLGPSEVGLLATVGVTQILCFQLPTVGVMSTGNELVEPGEPLQSGKIRDSNRAMLLSELRAQNFHPLDLGIAKDSAKMLLAQITDAFEKVDVIVTSGGVSMGEKDLVKEVLTTDLGAKIHFGRVFMKPGKPTTFATVVYKERKKLFFGLPGNPVSAMVTCNLYVTPALRAMSSESNPMRTKIKARLNKDIALDARPEYHRCILDWNSQDGLPVAESTGNQISSRLLSMRAANGILLLPASNDEKKVLGKGHIVDCLILSM